MSYNYIEGIDWNLHPDQFPGSAITMSGAGAGLPNNGAGTIKHNVIVAPANCGSNPNDFECNAFKSKWTTTINFENNTIVDYQYGINMAGADNFIMKNNIVKGTTNWHVNMPNVSGKTWDEDYNSFHEDTTDKYKYNGTLYASMSAYNTAAGDGRNANSITGDPGIDANYKPDNVNDAVVDAGMNAGHEYLKTVTWPVTSGGGSFTTQSDTTNPDIGAFTFPQAKPGHFLIIGP